MIATTYDPEADAMFIRYATADVKSDHTQEVAPGVLLDYAADGRMIATEVLDVSWHTAPQAKAA